MPGVRGGRHRGKQLVDPEPPAPEDAADAPDAPDDAPGPHGKGCGAENTF